MPRFGPKWLAFLFIPLGIGVGAANLGSWRPQRVYVPGQPFQVSFSPDGQRVAMASQSNTGDSGRVTVWEYAPPSRFRSPQMGAVRTFAVLYPSSICFSSDSQTLFCVEFDADKTIHRWNIATGKAAKVLHAWDGYMGRFAQTAPKSGDVTYWTGQSIEQRNVQNGHVKRRVELADDKHYEENPAEIVAFSPDGKMTAWPPSDNGGLGQGALLLRDASGRKSRLPALIPQSESLTCHVTALTFSPDSRFLVEAWDANITDKAGNESSSSRVALWDLQTRKLAAKWTEAGDSIRAHAFSPDGNLLAAARDDGAISLRDAHTGKLKRLLKTAGTSATSVAFSPDGRTLAACSSDGALYLWRVS